MLEMEEKLEWSDDRLLNLIDLYRDTPRLWDPNHSEYKYKYKKNDGWAEIALLASTHVEEVKRKMMSLLTSFRRERRRCERRLKSGAGIDEIYVSEWFAFDRLRFLLDKFPAPQTDSSAYLTDEEDQNIDTSKSSKRKKHKNHVKLLNAHTSENLNDTLAKRKKDQTSIFLDYVASKHRSYSTRTKSIVEHLISNILFEADMGKFELNDSNKTDLNTTGQVSTTEQENSSASLSFLKEKCEN